MLKSSRKFKIFILTILLVLIVCSILYILKYYNDINNAKKQSNLLNEISIDKTIATQKENNTVENNNIESEPIKSERILKLEELQKENPDIKAWIEIENTQISYPVLQYSDNDYYMNHNYKKEQTIIGSIFLDKNYCWDPPSSNLLIYGHNIKNGTMFQNLLNYKSKTFYEQHPTIRFTTNTEDANYEIISAFTSRVYYKYEQNVFRYYYFINANNENEFNEFVQNAKSSSFYDTGKTAKYGDQLMTLSTCSYHVKDGRFVVVARKST